MLYPFSFPVSTLRLRRYKFQITRGEIAGGVESAENGINNLELENCNATHLRLFNVRSKNNVIKIIFYSAYGLQSKRENLDSYEVNKRPFKRSQINL